MISLANADFEWIGKCVVNLFLLLISCGIFYAIYSFLDYALFHPVYVRVKRFLKRFAYKKWGVRF